MTATWLREYACALRSTVWIETLNCWRDDIFLCCSVLSCQTLFILVICIENFSAHKEIVSVVSMLSHEILMSHRRSALKRTIRAVWMLLNVLQDILQDILWDVISENISWLLQKRLLNTHSVEKYYTWIEWQENREEKKEIIENWAILESCMQSKECLRRFRKTA